MNQTLPFVFACAATAAAMAATPPLVTMDFKGADTDAGIVSSAEGLLEYHFDEGVEILPGGPTGTPFMQFDGSPEATVRINASKIGARYKGDEMGATFWFRPDVARKCTVGFGMSLGDGGKNVPVSFAIPTKKTDFDPYNLFVNVEDSIQTGVWHHVAISYSMSNLVYKIWVNGKPQRDFSIDGVVDQPAPVDAFFTLPLAKGFKGAIAEIKVWNTCPSPDDLFQVDVPPADAEATAKDFEAAAKSVDFKSFSTWCAANAAAAKTFGRASRVRDWMRLQEARRVLPEITAWVRDFAADALSDSFASSPLLPITIYPYSEDKRLPFLLPKDGKALGGIKTSGAPGEYESVSLMFYPLADARDFLVKAGDLTGPGGAKIPADEIDIKIVKCWYTTGAGWNSYFGGGRDYPSLSPELLLHDDALVKAVPGKRKNYLRLSYPTGDRYVDISRRGTPESIPILNYQKEPIHDAKTLQPLALEAGVLRQYWVTIHVPGSAKAGAYTGKLDFSIAGAPAGSMAVSLDVHPFTLPKAATRYNIDKRFWGTWMNTVGLDRKFALNFATRQPEAMTSLAEARQRLLNEYKDMAAHNMLNPWTCSFSDRNNPDLQELQLDLMVEAGLETRPLFGSTGGCEFDWCAGVPRNAKDYPNGDVSIEALPDLFHKSMSTFSNDVKRAFDLVEKKFGHREVYCYGIDEAGPGTVRREMPFFATIRHFGGKPFITMCHSKWVSFAVAADDTPAAIDRTNAQLWHEGGAETMTYAAPFSGPMNPVLWRRNKGIRLYMANYDGCNEYQLCGGTDIWNEFCANDRYNVFSIVLHSADGIIDTVAWDALREGFDDVRYLTLLRRLAREAIRGGQKKTVRLGRLAYAWAENIDQECIELDGMRADTVAWIKRLSDALSGDGVDIAPFSAY